MRKIALLGKKSYAGKRFKSVGPNELSASDKNSIRNNINQLTKQQLAFKIGKPITIIEKFINKEKLTSTLETPKVIDSPQPIIPIEALIIKPNITVSALESKERKKSDIAAQKIGFILKHYKHHSALEMAKMLNSSITSVRYHLKCLNIKAIKPAKAIPKSILERQSFIKENHKNYTVKEFAEKLNCSGDVIRIALHKLKIKALRIPLSQETPSEVIKFLEVNYRTMTAKELSNNLGTHSWTQVRHLCEKHGFLRTHEETTAIRLRWNRSEFTASEQKYILKNHGNISMLEISQKLNRTRSSVVKFLERKGLKITKEQHDALNKKNFEKARMKFQEKTSFSE
jgi:predicted ArsR family transcriptional regulator